MFWVGKKTLEVLKDEATCQRLYGESLHVSSEEGLSCAGILREAPRALHCGPTSTDGKAEAQVACRMFKASEHGSDRAGIQTIRSTGGLQE